MGQNFDIQVRDGEFCLLHGYEFMRQELGNPIAYCWKCEEDREEAIRNADDSWKDHERK